jgi:anti-sigma factor RsiW
MTNRLDPQDLNAFVDGELDLKRQIEIEQALAGDAELRAQVGSLRQLRASLRDGADYHAAPAALRQRLARPPALNTAPRSGVGAGARFVAAVQRLFTWRPLAASLGMALALTLSVNMVWLSSAEGERIRDDVVASHVRSTLGQHLVDVASSDQHTVKPWLSAKLDFSPPVSELALPGAVFLGGRIDYVDGRPVAALAYRQGQHVVNSFLWPANDRDRAPSFIAVRGFQVAHWTHAGMARWVISDLGRAPFESVVQALQAAEAAR